MKLHFAPMFDCKGGLKDHIHSGDEGLYYFAYGTRGKAAYCLIWKMMRFLN